MMEAALGVPVVQHDDGSRPGMHDLEVRLASEVRAAVEVTAAADPRCIALWKLVNGDDDRWIEEGLRGGWMVALRPSARARRLRDELPAMLREFEAAGVTQVHDPQVHGGGLEAAAADLHIADLYQGGTHFPGSIYLTIEDDLERRAGWVDGNPGTFTEWVGAFLASPGLADVRRKLAASGLPERHAFILVPGFTTAPFGVADLLMGHGVPTGTPTLPDEVTHVWLVSMWNLGTGWRWDGLGGWQPFDKLQDRAGADA